jgi:hypothetical protein
MLIRNELAQFAHSPKRDITVPKLLPGWRIVMSRGDSGIIECSVPEVAYDCMFLQVGLNLGMAFLHVAGTTINGP